MKKLTLGLIVGLLIGLSSNAFAAIGDIVEAKFSEFTFMVDGEVKELEADPLTYQGTTYLPVRVVANLLGKEVVYQADLRTIELNTPTGNQTESEGATTMDTVPILNYDGKIKSKKYLIETVKQNIAMYQGVADDPKTTEEERELMLTWVENNKKQLADLENQLAELEAKKAELEAQQ